MSNELTLYTIPSQKEAIMDVVFVHGLGGGPKVTWTTEDSKLFWPEWLSVKFSNIVVHSLGYPAGFFSPRGKEEMDIFEKATSTLDYLLVNGVGERPLALITHSFGGILAKIMLRKSFESDEAYWNNFSKMARLVVFLSTPHTGTSIAAVLKTVLPKFSSNFVDLLSNDKGILEDINYQYRAFANKKENFKTLVYYEKVKTNNVLVVSRSSADPGISETTPVAINKNHYDICKPSSKKDPVYKGIEYNLDSTLSTIKNEGKFEINVTNGTDGDEKKSVDIRRNLQKKQKTSGQSEIVKSLIIDGKGKYKKPNKSGKRTKPSTRVFISYSHDNESHKEWVEHLAKQLRSDGVNIRLDKWNLKPGADIPKFMENELKSANFTLAICSKSYVQKANRGEGGVGYEKMILSRKLMSNMSNDKIIPVIINNSGNNNLVPEFLSTKYYVDFRDPNLFEAKYSELSQRLLGQNFIPPLGSIQNKSQITEIELEKILQEKFGSQFTLENMSLNELKNTSQKLLKSISTKVFDRIIQEEVDLAIKSIWFPEFDREKVFAHLGREIESGKLSFGSNEEKCKYLALCSRYLSNTNRFDLAEKYYEIAVKLGKNEYTDIASAFIKSEKSRPRSQVNKLFRTQRSDSISAALTIMCTKFTLKSAKDWFDKNITDFSRLNSNGKVRYILLLFDLELWQDALGTLEYIKDEDFERVPALFFIVALVRLTLVVPEHLKSEIIKNTPCYRDDFSSLKSDKESLEQRKQAIQEFRKMTEIAQKMKLNEVSGLAQDYLNWLELEDPNINIRDTAFDRLKDIAHSSNSKFNIIPLAIAYGVDFDREKVELEMEKIKRPKGKLLSDIINARLVLALDKKTESESAEYIWKYRNFFGKYLGAKTAGLLIVDASARAGFVSRVNTQIKKLSALGLTASESEGIQDLIKMYSKESNADDYISVYNKHKSLQHLKILVINLFNLKEWEKLIKYSEKLFEITQNEETIVYYARNLYELEQFEKVISLLEIHVDFRDNLDVLLMTYCWSLYFRGDIKKAKENLEKSRIGISNFGFRMLKIQFCIELGELNKLSELIEDIANNCETIKSYELVYLARIAYFTGSNLVEKILELAVKRDPNNPIILAEAYWINMSSGFELNENTRNWFKKAVKLSDSKGPFQEVEIEKFSDEFKKMARFRNDLTQLLIKGKIPLYQYAHARNDTITMLTLYTAFANNKLEDPRHRALIPALSGKIDISRTMTPDKNICLDLTSIFTLSSLDLLSETISAFPTVYIPHSIVSRVFEERNEIRFHQPSRVKKSQVILELLAKDKIGKHFQTIPIDYDLADFIGNELTALLQVASNIESDVQKVVVTSKPVYRINSFKIEKVDLPVYKSVICGCLPIVNFLHQQGKLRSSQYNFIKLFFQRQEQLEDNEFKFEKNSKLVLYFDRIAISHFINIGIVLDINLFEKLIDCNCSIIISSESIEEANSLVEYDKYSEEVGLKLEKLMSFIGESIKGDKLIVGPIKTGTKNSDISAFEPIHPTENLFSILEKCDYVIIDDRSLNQSENMIKNKDKSKIVSTIDLLKFLLKSNKIDFERYYESLTKLRQMGYIFVPLELEELEYHFSNLDSELEEFYESGELRVIRENILRIRMLDWLQYPDEEHWLRTTLYSLYSMIQLVWKSDMTKEVKISVSNWLYELAKIRNWVNSFGNADFDMLMEIQKEFYFKLVMNLSESLEIEDSSEYWNWLSETILAPLKEENNNMFEKLVGLSQYFVESYVDVGLDKIPQQLNE